MRSWLEPILGSFGATIAMFAIWTAIVLAVLLIAIWIVRRYSRVTLGSISRGRVPRLAVVDAMALDSRRRLVLIRRDNLEHLILIGGPSDLVVEPSIHRPQLRKSAGRATGATSDEGASGDRVDEVIVRPMSRPAFPAAPVPPTPILRPPEEAPPPAVAPAAEPPAPATPPDDFARPEPPDAAEPARTPEPVVAAATEEPAAAVRPEAAPQPDTVPQTETVPQAEAATQPPILEPSQPQPVQPQPVQPEPPATAEPDETTVAAAGRPPLPQEEPPAAHEPHPAVPTGAPATVESPPAVALEPPDEAPGEAPATQADIDESDDTNARVHELEREMARLLGEAGARGPG